MADSTVIPHVIGTSAILMLFFVVANYYNGFYTNLNSEAYSAQLGQVGEYISSTLIDLVTLSQLTESDQFLTKDIAIPTTIGEKIYNISLITMTPSYGEAELMRVFTSIDPLNIYATSDLPWSMNSSVRIYVGQTVKKPSDITISRHLLSDAALSRAAQTDGFAKIIVWCDKNAENTTIGLGVWDLPGG
jgi:hypothetical protein